MKLTLICGIQLPSIYQEFRDKYDSVYYLPETAQHPHFHILKARDIVRQVNQGRKVLLITHSDYIVKELNNCLMLSHELKGKKKLLKELGYQDSEILRFENFEAFIYTSNTFEQVEFDKLGMTKSAFDEDVILQNHASNLIAAKISKYGVEMPIFDNTLNDIVEKSENLIEKVGDL